MRIVVDAAPPHDVRLLDADDFAGFRVDAHEVGAAALDATLRTGRLGRLEGDHAFIAVEGLRALAGERSPEWQDRLAAMIRFAAEHGWTAGDGSVRAHVVWAAGDGER